MKLDLSRAPGTFDIPWISVSMGRAVELSNKTIEGGRAVTLSAPYKGGWVAALVKNAEDR